MPELITILGPTATGKTSVAAALAARIGGEVISADSRQVYRGMDLGTGKDLDDYVVGNTAIPYHLIDIADPGEEYNLYRFQSDFIKAYADISKRGKMAIMCGGTGMYLESVILAYDLSKAPRNEALRKELKQLSNEELTERLKASKEVHNISDTNDRERLIRAIEISESNIKHPVSSIPFPKIKHLIIGVKLPREVVRKRITSRLVQRLDEGMIDEVKALLDSGLKPEQIEFYGLEYKFLTHYVTGKISYEDMFRLLNTAIHQFAKRQMTWFRRMEKKGLEINWIDGELPLEEKIEEIERLSDLVI